MKLFSFSLIVALSATLLFSAGTQSASASVGAQIGDLAAVSATESTVASVAFTEIAGFSRRGSFQRGRFQAGRFQAGRGQRGRIIQRDPAPTRREIFCAEAAARHNWTPEQIEQCLAGKWPGPHLPREDV